MSSATLAARTAHSVCAGWPRFNSWQENNSFLQKCGSDGLLQFTQPCIQWLYFPGVWAAWV